MTDEAQSALDRLRGLPELAPDPDLLEWQAPSGSTPEGLLASFRAMGFGAIADRRDAPAVIDPSMPAAPSEVRFEAWKKPRVAGAILAAALGVTAYLAVAATEAGEFAAVAAVVAVAYYVPLWILPSYRISGRIREGRVVVRLEASGLLARRDALERRLRFYLFR